MWCNVYFSFKNEKTLETWSLNIIILIWNNFKENFINSISREKLASILVLFMYNVTRDTGVSSWNERYV